MLKVIQTNNAPKAIGPYSQAIVVNNFVFCSGQIGSDPKTGDLVKGIEKQTRQVLQNLQALLEKADVNFSDVAKTTIYIRDMKNFAEVNTIYEEFFSTHKPARTTVEISNLPKGALVEIDVIAVIS